jgi:MFS family permease
VIELDLFKSSEFSLANVGNLVFYSAFAAYLLASVLFLTEVWHYSVLQAGFAFAPGPVMAALFAGITGRLADRFGAAIVGAPGGIVFAVACLMLIGLGAQRDYVGHYLPWALLAGAGIGIIVPAFASCAIAVVPADRLATGIGGSSAFRQIGAALGVAAFVALFGTPARTAVLAAFDRSFVFMVACGVAAALMMFVLAWLMRRREGPAADKAMPGGAVPGPQTQLEAAGSRAE